MAAYKVCQRFEQSDFIKASQRGGPFDNVGGCEGVGCQDVKCGVHLCRTQVPPRSPAFHQTQDDATAESCDTRAENGHSLFGQRKRRTQVIATQKLVLPLDHQVINSLGHNSHCHSPPDAYVIFDILRNASWWPVQQPLKRRIHRGRLAKT